MTRDSASKNTLAARTNLHGFDLSLLARGFLSEMSGDIMIIFKRPWAITTKLLAFLRDLHKLSWMRIREGGSWRSCVMLGVGKRCQNKTIEQHSMKVMNELYNIYYH